MNIDEITIGQGRALAALFGGAAPAAPAEPHPAVGKYCIIRCRDAGVHAGVVSAVTANNVTVLNARRLWRWQSAFTLSEASQTGIIAEGSKIAAVVPELHLRPSDACEFLPCTPAAENAIIKAPAHVVR